MRGISGERVCSRSDTHVVLEFFVSADCEFFDGHFPDFPILPAVGQFALVTGYAARYLEMSPYATRIKRMKCAAPLRPDTLVQLDVTLQKEKGLVLFCLRDAAVQDRLYSSGSFA